jgi:hypothetical protein
MGVELDGPAAEALSVTATFFFDAACLGLRCLGLAVAVLVISAGVVMTQLSFDFLPDLGREVPVSSTGASCSIVCASVVWASAG